MNRYRKKNKPTFALLETFIATLRPTRSEGTCRTYTIQLRCFHLWLKQNRVQLIELRRKNIIRWLIYLNKKGLSVGTRNNQIVTVRIYLRYLYEQGLIRIHADELIRRTDLPKLPVYLPRPLAPEIDRQLQNRLLKSKNPLHKALLLSRRTGLRISELMALDFDCIRTDFQGHSFLKVPLGKLNNERLVPLDNATIELVETLRNKGHKPRQWLLVTPTGKKTRYQQYLCALRDVCQGLNIADKMTIHRLRHTYATSLLSAGMSLTSVMKLLGHRDYRMTLRYAEITQEAVGKQYFEALIEIEKRYHFQFGAEQTKLFNPVKAVADVIRWLKNNAAEDLSSKKAARSLTKRLEQVRKDIESFRLRENQ